MTFRMIVLGGICAAAACASARGGRESRAACVLLDRQAPFNDGRPLYRDCAVDRTARLLSTNSQPAFPPVLLNGMPIDTMPHSSCFTADLEFVVDSTGVPEVDMAHVVHTSNPKFGAAVLATLQAWMYAPAVRDGIPVRQIVTEHRTFSMIVRMQARGAPPAGASSSEHLQSC